MTTISSGFSRPRISARTLADSASGTSQRGQRVAHPDGVAGGEKARDQVGVLGGDRGRGDPGPVLS